MADSSRDERIERMIGRHLRAGWWGLALFVGLGAALEIAHAIKAPLLLDGGHETTRLLLRLAHAHGTLVALVNVAFAFAFTIRLRPAAASPVASAALLAAGVLLPLGFFAGGLQAAGGDPGLGIILVPPGALALFVGAAIAGKNASSSDELR